ncbi:MAG: family 43 glycosylhydrolase [Lachnospiraceae bacterium]|nr:family 43 glycosylhydrolase [Lachnospiraceae bacterium]
MNQQNIVFSVYTRAVDPEAYPAGLAAAVHFAYEDPQGNAVPLNGNYGILFAVGEINRDDTILPIGVTKPRIFSMDKETIGICGRRILEDGTLMDGYFLWKTRDLIHFESHGYITGEELERWDLNTQLAVPQNLGEAAIHYWSPIKAKKVTLPKSVEIHAPEELEQISATVSYSDGSKAVKKVDWDPEDLKKLSLPVPENGGTCEVRGMIRRPDFSFPLAKGYGDPVIFFWEGKWYYISTNDNLDDIGLYVREGDTVESLFEEGVTEHLILPFDPERGLEQTFWAPEFHVIGGELYILFAVSGPVWGPQCQVMRFKKGGSIIRESDWEDPISVVRTDGSPLATDGITLDMTYIPAKSGSYMVWSYRRNIGTPLDTGSMLCIARVDEKKPWQLTSDPVLLSRPMLGWENVEGTINNEGPYAFQKDGKVYLTYSGGSANAYTYAVGLLTADSGDNLTDPASWNKSITPVLTFYSVEGVYGPGHNSFYTNEQGELMIAYHGETGLKETLRCDGIRRVHFRKDGTPYFQMAAQEDLPEEKREVRLTVTMYR